VNNARISEGIRQHDDSIGAAIFTTVKEGLRACSATRCSAAPTKQHNATAIANRRRADAKIETSRLAFRWRAMRIAPPADSVTLSAAASTEVRRAEEPRATGCL
jgi:hypothetical protein